MTPDTFILGDFNAHHASWYSRSTDTRGGNMADSINGSDYGILNWDSPTRVPPNAESSSSDVSLASACQILSMLSSDHLPILIRLQMKTTTTTDLRRTYVNLKKANWDRYRQEMEATQIKCSIPTDLRKKDPTSHELPRIMTSRTASTHTKDKNAEILLRPWTRRHMSPSCGEPLKELTTEQNVRQRTKQLPSMEAVVVVYPLP